MCECIIWPQLDDVARCQICSDSERGLQVALLTSAWVSLSSPRSEDICTVCLSKFSGASFVGLLYSHSRITLPYRRIYKQPKQACKLVKTVRQCEGCSVTLAPIRDLGHRLKQKETV